MDLKKIERELSPTDNVGMMVDYIKQSLDNFYHINKASIDNYDNWKVNCQKEDYLKSPQFKIYEIKNRNSPNVLVAKVKWMFLCDEKLFDDKYTVVFLGSIKKYPNLKEDKQLQIDIKEIFKCYFAEKSPNLKVNFADLKKMKEEVELYYYWKEKLVELEYRLKPIFYRSQSAKDKPEQIILNIKWGFEVLGKLTKPRYILKRYTVKHSFQNNLDDKSIKDELEQVVNNHINKVSPIIFTPPLQ
jgi:hypothetical protein